MDVFVAQWVTQDDADCLNEDHVEIDNLLDLPMFAARTEQEALDLAVADFVETTSEGYDEVGTIDTRSTPGPNVPGGCAMRPTPGHRGYYQFTLDADDEGITVYVHVRKFTI